MNKILLHTKKEILRVIKMCLVDTSLSNSLQIHRKSMETRSEADGPQVLIGYHPVERLFYCYCLHDVLRVAASGLQHGQTVQTILQNCKNLL